MRTFTKKSALLGVTLILVWSAAAVALPLRGRIVVVPRGPIYAPYFYGPLWGPPYPYVMRPTADVRVQVTPKQSEVYVDGFFAGVADDFDGVFARLHTTPGGHAITLHLEGYRTITENIYVRPDSTFKIHETMEKLAAGEVSAAPPPAAPRRR